jgi:hypothetical protein
MTDNEAEALATLGFTAPEPRYLSDTDQSAYDALMVTEDPTEDETTEGTPNV